MNILQTKLKLIEGWQKAYKYVSVQLAAILLLLPSLLPYMPEMASYLPTNWYQFLGGAILLARIIQQAKLTKAGAKDDAKPTT